MPLYAASISEMITMPVGVLTADYIDVWCNTATDTPHKIQVGDMIAVKWNADACDREYTWCTVLATTLVASGAELTLMHEQAVDVPGHPDGEPTHVTYNWKVYTSDYRTKRMVYNFDNAAEHTEHVLSFVSEVHFDDIRTRIRNRIRTHLKPSEATQGHLRPSETNYNQKLANRVIHLSIF